MRQLSMRLPIRQFILTLVLVALVGVFGVSAQDDTPTDAPSDGVSVTVYNQGSALVQDRRTLSLPEGTSMINFTDVAAAIDATSVSFNSLTDPDGTVVLEQNYVYDLVNSEALLQRYLDETIVLTTEDGAVFTGQLLSGRSGEVILRNDAGEVTVISLGNVRDIQFPELPEGLITRPTLRWLVNSATGGDQQVELTYLTGGMSWTADYIVLLAQDESSIDLNGWVTLNNNSGTAYRDALLKLVAGDVNRIQPEVLERQTMEMAYAEAAPMADESVAQREFYEYQLYEINRPVTIGMNETKQVEFVTGADVPANTFYVYDSSPYFYGYSYFISDQYYGQTGITDVQNFIEFTTDEEGGLGADLPAGRVRVYQEDTDGAALLIGENNIDHTAEGEMVEFYLGNAFDLVGERTQVDFQIVSNSVVQETYEIKLRNRKDDETVEIRVPEHLFRWSNWEILDATAEYEKLNASTIEFRPQVAPGEEVTIRYTVRYTWPESQR
ncbi:DUF4139 domain-containing protein [Phototrophicus methaneseepsis]|uniref:DUF4139 domain-containing protein n=1 Tax=Phototrophicus methaneseepsis TaxID=2710758 RepID=A0A7S8IED0_9CHLR|nr:DUF4139 domain-containing protein [Phototrophicus methaneseepsis]QPC82452.1 DUF4139 domain-containing protein [Phototrophicus methaneseepsis]